MEQKIGRYQLGPLIGEGAYTSVYRTFDEKLQRDVALKLLRPVWRNDPQAVQRFKQEAKEVARLGHPHIATVFEVGEAEGQVYFTQFLVEGETLAARLKRGPLSWSNMTDILYPVAEALTYAHSRGVIHRDVKPANILLGNDGTVYLTDFGLVRVAEGSATLSSTSSGMAGTPPYMAPELWEGKKTTSAIDVYALSCVVVEMLTGRALFDGPTPAAIREQHLCHKLEFPAELPADLPKGAIDVLKWGLAPEASQRIRTAGELAFVLIGLTGSPQPVPIHSLSLPRTPIPFPPSLAGQKDFFPEPRRKRSGLSVATITALIVATIGLAVLACLFLYLFDNSLPSVAAQSPTSTELAGEVNEAPVAAVTPMLPTATVIPSMTPTSQPPTATPQPPTATAPIESQPTNTVVAQQADILLPTATNTATAESRPTATAVVESSPSATPTALTSEVIAVSPSDTPTPTLPPPTATSTPAGPIIPAGQGLLMYENKTDYDLVVDLINPTTNTMVATATLPPHTQKAFFLEPGHYVFQAHTAGGKITLGPVDFDIVEGKQAERMCC